MLVSVISVDKLTFENLSCLNTALIILMLAARQGTLVNCLNMLATATIKQLKLGYLNYFLKQVFLHLLIFVK